MMEDKDIHFEQLQNSTAIGELLSNIEMNVNANQNKVF
jgi:hypothetical protein